MLLTAAIVAAAARSGASELLTPSATAIITGSVRVTDSAGAKNASSFTPDGREYFAAVACEMKAVVIKLILQCY